MTLMNNLARCVKKLAMPVKTTLRRKVLGYISDGGQAEMIFYIYKKTTMENLTY